MAKIGVVALTLAVLAGAGTMIVGQVRQLWPELGMEKVVEPIKAPSPPTIQARRPDPVPQKVRLDWSSVIIRKADGRAVVSLSPSHTASEETAYHTEGQLTRELFRQTLLIAAREGLGATIRDGVLEKPESGQTNVGLELQFSFHPIGKAKISLQKGDDGRSLWSSTFAVSSMADYRLSTLVEKLEPISRDKLLDALKKEGVTPAGSGASKSGQVPEVAARALEQMTFVSQYSAARSLTEAARSGASAEQLGALARAFANLGVLTEYHWSPAHKAYDARALLYSQRLVALYPDSPWSYWNRAYVRGLIGLHQEALIDLEEAGVRLKKLPAGQRPTPPAWAHLVKQLCEYDTSGLMAQCSDPTLAPLASTLALMTVENSKSTSLAIKVAEFARRVNPDNPWINDASFQIRKLSHLHRVTTDGIEQFDGAFSREMAKVSGLPVEVSEQLRADGGEVKVTKALIEAGTRERDRADLSWAVLGRMAREARFATVAHRVEFMATMWSVPIEDFIDEVRPLVSDHPYWPALLAYAVDHGFDPGTTLDHMVKMATQEYEVADDFYSKTLEKLCGPASDMRWRALSKASGRQFDFVARDVAKGVQLYGDHSRLDIAKRLISISPESPIGWASSIEAGWDKAKADRANLERKFAEHPEVLVALGKSYAAENRLEDAERAFAAAIKISPDQETYAALASVYKSLGKMDRWKETLDAFLVEEDPGLDHARVQVELARYFMGRREYAKAQPYAEAAAQTWAAWAMLCAAECHEQMEDWDKAELWYRRDAERYRDQEIVWYYFCARTGHGDRAAAAELMDQFITSLGEDATPTQLRHFGPYFILTRRPKQALEVYQKLWASSEKDGSKDRIFIGAQLASLADELGDKELCVKTLEEVATGQAKQAPMMSSICRMLHDWLASPQPGPLDLGPIDKVFDDLQDDGRGQFGYYVGRFLVLHGQAKESQRFYGYTARRPDVWYVTRYLAFNALRDQGVKVGPHGEH